MKNNSIYFLLAGAAILAYFVLVHKFEPTAPERMIESHRILINCYNAANNTQHPYATLSEVEISGPGLAQATVSNWRIQIRQGINDTLSATAAHDLIAHETAHLLARQEYSSGTYAQSHGPEWRRVYEWLLANCSAS